MEKGECLQGSPRKNVHRLLSIDHDEFVTHPPGCTAARLLRRPVGPEHRTRLPAWNCRWMEERGGSRRRSHPARGMLRGVQSVLCPARKRGRLRATLEDSGLPVVVVRGICGVFDATPGRQSTAKLSWFLIFLILRRPPSFVSYRRSDRSIYSCSVAENPNTMTTEARISDRPLDLPWINVIGTYLFCRPILSCHVTVTTFFFHRYGSLSIIIVPRTVPL